MKQIPPAIAEIIKEHLPDVSLDSALINFPQKLSTILQDLQNSRTIKIGAFDFDHSAKTINGTPLTEKEAEIIHHLHNVQKATKEELLEKIWGYSASASTNTVETHIYRLRSKLEQNLGVALLENSGGQYFLKA